jgi:hypothetical protein
METTRRLRNEIRVLTCLSGETRALTEKNETLPRGTDVTVIGEKESMQHRFMTVHAYSIKYGRDGSKRGWLLAGDLDGPLKHVMPQCEDSGYEEDLVMPTMPISEQIVVR